MKNIKYALEWRLCVGCGACSYICPKNRIMMIDIVDEGIRPVIEEGDCNSCNDCLKVCPGIATSHSWALTRNDSIKSLRSGFGPILDVWEGYAADSDLRFNGSSGGAASALALYCLEIEKMHGVLHIAADPEVPWKNVSVFSFNRHELLQRTGSRYAPASPCQSLKEIEIAEKPSVFIGKPCDIAGLRKAELMRPDLHKKVGLTIGIFCAGSPSSKATMDLMHHLEAYPARVAELRYRGKGWPGHFTIRTKDEDNPVNKISYKEAWSFLQKYRPYRCYLCPDGTGEFADISCGDPWYRDIRENTPGYSLVLARTERGRKFLQGAMEKGYIVLERGEQKILKESQNNLLLKRSAIWGRLLVFKTFGIPNPRLEGFFLFKSWCNLSTVEKARSIAGTVRRIIQRKYYLPNRIEMGNIKTCREVKHEDELA
jgi:coenzyme F420 hydrogenase subunit beta